jgi:murein DD-endopeptidase MepM/ murein hydrolase activator NlpD
LHHASKRRRYSIILVPSGDAGDSRNYHVAPWQVAVGLLVLASLGVALVLAVLFFTPVATIIEIPNPTLENRYSRELLAINRRMESIMEQLLEVQAYNLKLRKALGELVGPADTAAGGRREPERSSRGPEAIRRPEASRAAPQPETVLPSMSLALATVEQRPGKMDAVFPAVMPTEGYITQGFSAERRHFGLDIAGRTGSVVNAAADGHVVFAGWTQDDGYVLILSHAGGFLTYYKHNQALLKSSNAFVRRGEPIALLGSSGHTSLGPHLHFEIWKDGTPVDPALYLLNINS